MKAIHNFEAIGLRYEITVTDQLIKQFESNSQHNVSPLRERITVTDQLIKQFESNSQLPRHRIV